MANAPRRSESELSRRFRNTITEADAPLGQHSSTFVRLNRLPRRDSLIGEVLKPDARIRSEDLSK